MIIIEENNKTEIDLIEVVSAQYIGDYVIRLIFNDGIKRLVDFRTFLENSAHPSIRKYWDESKFKNFQIVDGNLNWNDYEMIFPLEDLYEGKL